MLSLFRLIDINMGSIMLDGVDTSSIALDLLRKQLAIIPQVSRQTGWPLIVTTQAHAVLGGNAC
jgi:ABC-type transport system involved in Fe-S cluster assembly fused permease/ATPase subunit